MVDSQPAPPAKPATAVDYIQRLDEVPGWFLPLDASLLVGIDALQRERGVKGDLLEIGTYQGKSAILLAYLTREAERLIVCDVFEEMQPVGGENAAESSIFYPTLRRTEFEERFLRFHDQLPTVWQMASTSIDRAAIAGTCRLVHVDGSHAYEVVREDIVTARAALVPGGVVVFDDWSTAHAPGVAVALWEEFFRGQLQLLCLTPLKMYATWDRDGIRREEVEGWIEAQADLQLTYAYRLAGREVRAASVRPSARADASGSLPSGGGAFAPREEPRLASTRAVIRQIAPPLLLTGYRRVRDAYRARRGRPRPI